MQSDEKRSGVVKPFNQRNCGILNSRFFCKLQEQTWSATRSVNGGVIEPTALIWLMRRLECRPQLSWPRKPHPPLTHAAEPRNRFAADAACAEGSARLAQTSRKILEESGMLKNDNRYRQEMRSGSQSTMSDWMGSAPTKGFERML